MDNKRNAAIACRVVSCSPDAPIDDSILDDYRRRCGLGEAFDREVNETFRERVLDQYRSAFEAYLRDSKLGLDDVGRVLGTHRGTVSRWIRRQSRIELTDSSPGNGTDGRRPMAKSPETTHLCPLPSAICPVCHAFISNTIFLYLAARDISPGEVGFPRGLDAKLEAMSATLADVLRRINASGRDVRVDRRQVEILQFVSGHPRLKGVASGTGAARSDVLRSIIDDLAVELPLVTAPSQREVEDLLDRLFIPWVLLQDALCSKWVPL